MKPLVLLVYGRNFPYPYDAQPPLGLYTLGAALEARGFEAAYFDERVQGCGELAALLRRGPLLAGFSVMGGYQAVSARRLTRLVRRLAPGAKTAWGGYFPTALPAEALGTGGADYALSGEAEESLPALCEALAKGTAPRLPGMVAAAAAVFFNPYSGAALAELQRYLGRRAARERFGFEGSRGCGRACAFCAGGPARGPVRVKPAAQAAAELDALAAAGVKELDVVDDLFAGGGTEDMRALAAALGRRGFAWSANLRIDLAEPALLGAFKENGCDWLYFGLESDDEAELRRLAKGYGAAALERGLAALEGWGRGLVLSVLAGQPGAGDAGVAKARDFALRLRRRFPRAEVQVQSFVPLPGTPFYEEALRLGWRPPAGAGWSRHDHFSVRLPWLRRPRLPRRLYLASFLAWRCGRHLPAFPFGLPLRPLSLLSRWRLRRGCFIIYFEGALYAAAERLFRLWRALVFFLWETTARKK